MWAPHQVPNPRNKTPRSPYKILSKLTEIFLRRLSMTGSYYVQNGMARRICGPHTKSWTPEIKPRVHTIDFYQNWLNFFLKRLSMTGSYSVQNSVARPTRGPYVKRAVTRWYWLKPKQIVSLVKSNQTGLIARETISHQIEVDPKHNPNHYNRF